MDKRTQAQIILEELNEQYSIPTYMEEYAIKGILAGLTRIELAEETAEKLKQPGRRKHDNGTTI